MKLCAEGGRLSGDYSDPDGMRAKAGLVTGEFGRKPFNAATFTRDAGPATAIQGGGS